MPADSVVVVICTGDGVGVLVSEPRALPTGALLVVACVGAVISLAFDPPQAMFAAAIPAANITANHFAL